MNHADGRENGFVLVARILRRRSDLLPVVVNVVGAVKYF